MCFALKALNRMIHSIFHKNVCNTHTYMPDVMFLVLSQKREMMHLAVNLAFSPGLENTHSMFPPRNGDTFILALTSWLKQNKTSLHPLAVEEFL